MPPSPRSQTNLAHVTDDVLRSAWLWSIVSQTSRNRVVRCIPTDAATTDEGEVVLTLAVFRGDTEGQIEDLAREIRKDLQDWEKSIFDLKDPSAFDEMLDLQGDPVMLQFALSDAMGKAYQRCWDDDTAIVRSNFPGFYVEIGVTRNDGGERIQEYSRKLVITISNDPFHGALGPVWGASNVMYRPNFVYKIPSGKDRGRGGGANNRDSPPGDARVLSMREDLQSERGPSGDDSRISSRKDPYARWSNMPVIPCPYTSDSPATTARISGGSGNQLNTSPQPISTSSSLPNAPPMPGLVFDSSQTGQGSLVSTSNLYRQALHGSQAALHDQWRGSMGLNFGVTSRPPDGPPDQLPLLFDH
ncbi:hypothetical protein M231_06764 [Tremella mesenterica]|uniref:Uncharacterized protein n=1 Tax=Tremella mesenterica TaxID=5217 RepID=A0A4Q1BG09_TREME|nr:hypothetical protein M231_06764 [Tremella mesenterica]